MSRAEALQEIRARRGAPDTYVAGINQALRHAMDHDPSLLIFGEDVARIGGLFNATAGIAEAHPDRIFDTPISEGGYVGLAVGAAMLGRPVVAEIQIVDFIWLAADQLAHAASLHFISNRQVHVPLVVRGPSGFGTGFGATHTQRLESLFAGRPGVKTVMPSTPWDAKGLLTAAILDPDPVVIFEEATLYYQRGELPADGVPVPLGSAKVVAEGGDCTVVTAGRPVHVALEARQALLADDVALEVIDLRTLSPIDWPTIVWSVEKTGRVIVCFDGPLSSTLGHNLAGQIAQRCWGALTAAPVAVGGIDICCPVSRPAEDLVGVDVAAIIDAAKRLR